MRLAIIPARGGSKRIPRKNIKDFNGKAMIGWSIEAALLSSAFDEVWVSTDDAEIAAVAESFGAKVPFIRPAELSDDHTGTSAVVRHAISWALQQQLKPELVACIYATAPLLQSQMLNDAMRQLQRVRLRNGSFNWSLSRDIGDPSIWTERFQFPTWGDYLRTRDRYTQADLQAQAFADAHPGLYDTTGGRPHLAVQQGQLDLTSLHVPGFASAAAPVWRSLQTIA